MKVYICCPIPAAEEAKRVKQILTQRGHTVVSRWIDDPRTGYGSSVGTAPERAIADFEDVEASDTLVVLPREGSRGGTHSELGMGLAWRKRVILVGPRTNIFHWHPAVAQFDTLKEALEVL